MNWIIETILILIGGLIGITEVMILFSIINHGEDCSR